jgi:hypothetical protein
MRHRSGGLSFLANNGSFADGFREGYASVLGTGAPMPGFSADDIPAGKTPFQHGIGKGIEAALKRKSEREKK